MEHPTPPVLRQSVLEELRTMLDVDGLVDVIETYLDDTPRRLQEMHRAIVAGEAPLVCRTAHSLKGSSATFGADDMTALCLELETAARAGSLDSAAENAALIEREFERLRPALLAELGRIRE